MHLFLVTHGGDADLERRARAALRGVLPIFPALDPATAWERRAPRGEWFACGCHHPLAAIGKRQYVATAPGEMLLMDGTAVDPSGRLAAHRAEALREPFEVCAESLEGRFAAARLSDDGSIEVLVDPLGMYQLYVLQAEGAIGFSNSVELLRRAFDRRDLDPAGAALFVFTGWVGSDRTLVDGVRVVPGGILLRIDAAGAMHTRRTFDPCRLESGTGAPRALIDQAADTLRDLVLQLDRAQGPLECQITGGYQTRVVAAACHGAGLRPRFVTRGVESHVDVVLARALCRVMDGEHQVIEETPEDVDAGFDRAVPRLIGQGDGLISLWQLADVVRHPDAIGRLEQTLGGMGGNVTRGRGLKKAYYALGEDAPALMDWLIGRMDDTAAPLLTAAGQQLARDTMRASLEDYLARGARPSDLGNQRYAGDQLRRWAGTNARKVEPVRSTFAPIANRAFVIAAFRMSHPERKSMLLHGEVIHRLAPRLLSVPFDRELPPLPKAPWWKRLGKPAFAWPPRAHEEGTVGHVGARRDVFDLLRERLRDRVLARPQSPVFDLVDRQAFADLTTVEGFAARGREHLGKLYAIATIREYEDRMLRA